MKFISWNVNGFRACLGKGFEEYFKNMDADIFCIQETKMQPGQADFSPEGYTSYFHSAEKKGYSGTATFSKIKPINVFMKVPLNIVNNIKKSLGKDSLLLEENNEGRIIVCEYDKFFLVNCYTPNSKRELERLQYRQLKFFI